MKARVARRTRSGTGGGSGAGGVAGGAAATMVDARRDAYACSSLTMCALCDKWCIATFTALRRVRHSARSLHTSKWYGDTDAIASYPGPLPYRTLSANSTSRATIASETTHAAPRRNTPKLSRTNSTVPPATHARPSRHSSSNER
eukprot:4827256-Pleurochrysis_carterae.AAC.2